MSRVITSSEVDRLHCQVAELQQQVRELQQAPNLTPSRFEEMFEVVQGVEESRSDADDVVDEIANDGKDLPR